MYGSKYYFPTNLIGYAYFTGSSCSIYLLSVEFSSSLDF